MANAAGLIHESIWRDDDYRNLSRGAQALFMQLLSQKEVDCAGVLPLQPEKWAKGCAGLTVEQVMADLDELQQAHFVYYDTETYEACIRSYIRRAPNVMKSPNMRKSARRAATLVASPTLRAILAAELRATGDPECIVTAEQICPTPHPGTAVSKQTSEPFRNPSGTLPEPSSESESESETHLSSTKEGSARPQCSKHPNGNSERSKCHQCRLRRLWDEQHAAGQAADELEAKRRARDTATKVMRDCHDCGDDGWLLGPDRTPVEPAVKCHHQRQEQHA